MCKRLKASITRDLASPGEEGEGILSTRTSRIIDLRFLEGCRS
jgi:hypothetical protein